MLSAPSTASISQSGISRALAGEFLAKQVYEHAVRLGKIRLGVGVRLGRFVHQLGFGNTQHGWHGIGINPDISPGFRNQARLQ
jgi:hypothetical protein